MKMYLKISILTVVLFLSTIAHAQNRLTAYAGFSLPGEQRYSIDFWKNEGVFWLNIPEGIFKVGDSKSELFGRIQFPVDARYEVFNVLGKAQEYDRIIQKNSLAPFTEELGTIRKDKGDYSDAHWKCLLHNPQGNTVYLLFSLENSHEEDVVMVKSSDFSTLEELMKKSYELEEKAAQ